MEPDKPKKLGRYEIVRELGKGAMGIVYEGLDPVINRRVAVKTARHDIMQISGRAQEMMERFLREAHAAGALNHPGIVTIYDASEENGIAYIAMEYFENGNLQDHIRKHGPFSPDQVVAIGVTTCRALHVAHEAGVIHRDIKPANIMMRQDGSIKVADFGIAHVSDSNLTQEGALIGTPAYMSPEQFMGHKIDGRADLFAVAVMLYEMLTGEKPFPGETFNAVMHKVIKTDPIPPDELNLAVDKTLNQVILKALQKNPKQRYQTGNALADALSETLKDEPDPKILGLESITIEKTVITTDDETETVIENAPPRTDTHIIASPIKETASATVIGEPPPGIQTTASFIKPTTKIKRSYIIAGIITVVMIVLIGITFMNPVKSTPPPVTPGNENAFTQVSVAVVLAPTQEAYDAATERNDYSLCDTTKSAKATVTIKNAKTKENLIKPTAITNAEIIPLPTPCAHILVEAEAEGYTPSGLRDIKPATKPDETAQCDIVLLKKRDGTGG